MAPKRSANVALEEASSNNPKRAKVTASNDVTSAAPSQSVLSSLAKELPVQAKIGEICETYGISEEDWALARSASLPVIKARKLDPQQGDWLASGHVNAITQTVKATLTDRITDGNAPLLAKTILKRAKGSLGKTVRRQREAQNDLEADSEDDTETEAEVEGMPKDDQQNIQSLLLRQLHRGGIADGSAPDEGSQLGAVASAALESSEPQLTPSTRRSLRSRPTKPQQQPQQHFQQQAQHQPSGMATTSGKIDDQRQLQVHPEVRVAFHHFAASSAFVPEIVLDWHQVGPAHAVPAAERQFWTYDAPRIFPISKAFSGSALLEARVQGEALREAFRQKITQASNYEGEPQGVGDIVGLLQSQLQHLHIGDEGPNMHLLNITITDDGLNRAFAVPEEMLGITCSKLDTVKRSLSANITLRGSCVGPCTRNGASRISCSTGRKSAVWFFWPYTPRNASVLAALGTPSSPNRFDWSSFEHGLVAFLTSVDAIYIPPNCIHATITIFPGTFVGSTFYEPAKIRACTQALLDNFDSDGVREHLLNFVRYQHDAVEIGIFETYDAGRLEAMQGLLNIEERLRGAYALKEINDIELRKSLQPLYTRLRERYDALKGPTLSAGQCSRHPGEQLTLDHVLDEHVYIADGSKSRTKNKGKAKRVNFVNKSPDVAE